MIGCTLAFASLGLTMATTGHLFAGLIGIASALLCITVFAATLRRIAVFLDREADQLTLRTRTWRGQTNLTYPLSYLGEAVVQTQNRNQTETYRLALRLTGGMDAGEHPMTWLFVHDTQAFDAADAINAWLMGPVDSMRAKA